MKKCILTNTGAKIQHCARTHKSFCKVLPFISNILSHIKNNCIPHQSTSCRAQARRHLTDNRKGARRCFGNGFQAGTRRLQPLQTADFRQPKPAFIAPDYPHRQTGHENRNHPHRLSYKTVFSILLFYHYESRTHAADYKTKGKLPACKSLPFRLQKARLYSAKGNR